MFGWSKEDSKNLSSIAKSLEFLANRENVDYSEKDLNFSSIDLPSLEEELEDKQEERDKRRREKLAESSTFFEEDGVQLEDLF